MSDLIDDPAPGQNTPEYSVSELSGAVKRTLEGEFGRVRVKGEVGRVVRARSGHLYFDVKDDRSALACTTWKGQVAGLSVIPEEGMEVVVSGRMTAYGAQSKYNLNVSDVAVAGQGALLAMLEKRKALLAAEGLFDDSRKQAIPFLPDVIGVVTSPTGAVIRDILHRLRDRFPRKVLIWPVAVQGQNCAPEVANAIKGFNAMTAGGALPRPDLIIVARGGGSVEDLWGFNEEIVARAAAGSDIPLISAVGHETDTTLIDFVSDKRAPTPTAAAELAVPVRMELLAWVEEQGGRLTRAVTQGTQARGQRLKDIARALPRPEGLTEQASHRLDTMDQRLRQALTAPIRKRQVQLAEASGGLKPSVLERQISNLVRRLEDRAGSLRPALARTANGARRDFSKQSVRLQPTLVQRSLGEGRANYDRLSKRLSDAGLRQMAGLESRLEGLDRVRMTLGYEATLERGYAVVRGGAGLVTTAEAASQAESLEIQFADGRVTVGAGRVAASLASALPSKPKKPKQKPSSDDQGDLF